MKFANSFQADAADRRTILLVILISTTALAYFYAADNYFFSTRFMSPIFQVLLMVYDSKTAWLTLGVCILAAYWRDPRPFLIVVDYIGLHAVIVAMACTALLALGAIFVYHGEALSMDEYAVLFQAKIFAAGRLTGQLPPSIVDWLVPSGFNGGFIVASRSTGLAIEAYWPGFALLLAPFVLLGIPWLCNASLAGLSILLIHRITLQITGDRRAAGWSVLFTIASGAFAANAICYYSLQARLAANLLFVWLLLKPTCHRAFGAGIVGSFALVLHSPYPHAIFAAPWILGMAFSKQQRRLLPFLLLGYLPILIFVSIFWLQLRHTVGGIAGMDVIGTNIDSAFTLPSGSMIDIRAAALVKMWVWAVPGLFLFALLGRLRHGADRSVRLLALSAITTFVGYIFVVFDQGHGWGYRYFHSAWGVIPILAGCGMTARPESVSRLAAYAGAAAMLNLLIVIPYQMTQINGIVTRHAAALPQPQRPGNNVYFIHPSGGFYIADLIQTDPLLRAPDLRLLSRGPKLDAELRLQNWPNAVLVARNSGAEEWNLGPVDQRRVDSRGIKRFVLMFSEQFSDRIMMQ